MIMMWVLYNCYNSCHLFAILLIGRHNDTLLQDKLRLITLTITLIITLISQEDEATGAAGSLQTKVWIFFHASSSTRLRIFCLLLPRHARPTNLWPDHRLAACNSFRLHMQIKLFVAFVPKAQVLKGLQINSLWKVKQVPVLYLTTLISIEV